VTGERCGGRPGPEKEFRRPELEDSSRAPAGALIDRGCSEHRDSRNNEAWDRRSSRGGAASRKYRSPHVNSEPDCSRTISWLEPPVLKSGRRCPARTGPVTYPAAAVRHAGHQPQRLGIRADAGPRHGRARCVRLLAIRNEPGAGLTDRPICHPPASAAIPKALGTAGGAGLCWVGRRTRSPGRMGLDNA